MGNTHTNTHTGTTWLQSGWVGVILSSLDNLTLDCLAHCSMPATTQGHTLMQHTNTHLNFGFGHINKHARTQ